MTGAFKAALAALALAAALPALAHHGFRGSYDRSTAYWLDGEVVEVYFGMPHVEVAIRLARGAPPETAPEGAEAFMDRIAAAPDNAFDVEEVLFPQQRRFLEMGRALEPGDRVAVIAYRACEPPRPFRGQWILLPDGSHRLAAGKVQNEVEHCVQPFGRD